MNMVETHNSKPIASTRVGDNGTVLVMGIHYDEALTCDRKCSVLGPDDDGILVCGYDNVKNIVKDTLSDYIWKKTKRRPMIMPIIMDTHF